MKALHESVRLFFALKKVYSDLASLSIRQISLTFTAT